MGFMSYEGVYVIETPFYDIEMGSYEIGMSFCELARTAARPLGDLNCAMDVPGLFDGVRSESCADSGWDSTWPVVSGRRRRSV